MFNNIQMLRAVAAAMVFFFHADPHYQALRGAGRLFSSIASFGFAGVDIFFVISGFVVAHTTLERSRNLTSAWKFARRRVLRIYLGYWPFLALTLLLAYLYTPEALAEFDLLRSFFLATIDAKRTAVYVAWSLSFELLFYATVTATFVLPAVLMKRASYTTAIVVFGVLLWTLGVPHNTAMMFLSFSLEFLVGFVVYIHRQKFCSMWLIGPLAMVVIAAFSAGVQWQANNGSLRILTFGTGAVALVMLALLAEQSRFLIANKTWVALGDSSYTLYLFHPSLLTAFYWWGLRDFLAAQPEIWRDTGFFLLLALGLWTSHHLYRMMERPLYRWATTERGAKVPR